MPSKLDISGEPMPEREDDGGSMELGDRSEEGKDHPEPEDDLKSLASTFSHDSETALMPNKGKKRVFSDSEDTSESDEVEGKR